MIKHQRRPTTDIRGVITTGKRSAKGYPQALSYYDVSDFPEVIQAYGPTPDAVVVYMPSNVLEECFGDEKVVYAGFSGGVKIRGCNWDEPRQDNFCIHRINETVEGITYAAGEETKCICPTLPDKIIKQTEKGPKEVPNPQKCKYAAWFKVWIGFPPKYAPDNSSCYLFKTGSENSGIAVKSELESILTLNNGILKNVPFLLKVKMVGGKTDAKQKFPVWHLQAMELLSKMRQRNYLQDGLEPEVAMIVSNNKLAEMLRALEEIETNEPSPEKLSAWVDKYKEDAEKLDPDSKETVGAAYTELKAKVEGTTQ